MYFTVHRVSHFQFKDLFQFKGNCAVKSQETVHMHKSRVRERQRRKHREGSVGVCGKRPGGTVNSRALCNFCVYIILFN